LSLGFLPEKDVHYGFDNVVVAELGGKVAADSLLPFGIIWVGQVGIPVGIKDLVLHIIVLADSIWSQRVKGGFGDKGFNALFPPLLCLL